MRRRTKIICTIGPSVDSPEMLGHLIEAGMDVARLNFSHGDHAEHQRRFETIRRRARELEHNVAVMMDLQGPKIRTGPMEDGATILLQPGDRITLTTEDVTGSQDRISTSYKHLPNDVQPGDRILIADGMIELAVRRVTPPDVLCDVVRGGHVGQFKGINLPGVNVAEPSLTEKDRSDLAFGLALGVDYVALSFVRRPDDLRGIRKIIDESNAPTRVVAKIERPEALDHIDEIIALSDAVMVARGDLGVEIDFARVPEVQKDLIHRCNVAGVPVITATQMLESMVDHSQPTRAEVTDVANAIYDGTDAVMLSGETAAGKYPIEACATMARIAYQADQAMAEAPPAERMVRLRTSDLRNRAPRLVSDIRKDSFADAIGQAVVRMTEAMPIRRIVCFTRTGYTASAISRYRSPARITAITNNEAVQRRLALFWGVQAYITDDIQHTEQMVQRVEKLLLEHGLTRNGDTIIIVSGSPQAVGGRTNLLKLHVVGREG